MKKDIKHVAVIDLAHIFHTYWHASAHKNAGAAFTETINKVHKISAEMEYDTFVLAVDSPPYRRTAGYPAYKANRARRPPELDEQYRETQQRLVDEGFIIWKEEGEEADDIIASVAKLCTQMDIACTIFSRDKDLMQLVDDADNIRMASTRDSRKILKEQDVHDYMIPGKHAIGVRPDRVGDYLALIGDTSDNIPGCKNLGPVTAIKLIQTYDDWDTLMAACKSRSVIGLKPDSAATKNLFESVGDMQMSRELVRLRDDIKLPWSDLYKETDMEEEEQEFDAMQEEMKSALGVDEEEEGRATGEVIRRAVAEIKANVHPDGKGDSLEDVHKDVALNRYIEKQGYKDEPHLPPPIPTPADVEALIKRNPDVGVKPRKVYYEEPSKEPAAQPVASIELRPGVSLTSDQFRLMEAMADRLDKGELYSGKYRNKAAILSVMLLGVELGLSPQLMLNNCHIVERKPTLASSLLIGLAEQCPDCEYLVCIEETDKKAVYKTKSRSYPEERTFTYTMEDAKKAGMTGNNWNKRPREMLRKTAGSQAARLWYPSAIAGLYSTAEMGAHEE